MADLPVDPQRLQQEFPDLTAADLEAYVAVTRRILEAGPRERARVTREAVEGGRRARERAAAGAALSREEALALRYLDAVDKMQRSSRTPPR